MSVWTLFGGKGGVGKTTCAAAWALARASSGQRVVVLSTDPAHSLADAFDSRLTPGRPYSPTGSPRPRLAKPRMVAPRLCGLEIDSPSAVARWVKTRRPALASLLDRGTLLDREDIARVLGLPLPGLDELAAFLVMAEFNAGDYDEVVVDTAPTGHARRLFETPGTVAGVGGLFEAMHDRHAMVAQALGGIVGVNELVEELREHAAAVERRLRDPHRTGIVWVTLPEPLAIAETLDGIAWLRAGRFPLASVVVNRLTALPLTTRARCAECLARSRGERSALAPLLRAVRAGRPPIPVRVVPAYGAEPRGLAALRRLGRALAAPVSPRDLRPPARGPASRPARVRPAGSHQASPLALGPARLLFFGGKGGVGKTTCAAAVALDAATSRGDRVVRLISTDPAPSLADVFKKDIGDRWTPIDAAGRLQARELDSAAVFGHYRDRYLRAVGDSFHRLRGGSSVDAVADRAVFERLFVLAPPGIDELIALLTVVDLLEEHRDDLLIVDTAPTGHALRLLAMQDDVRQWVEVLMRLMLKYQLAAKAEWLASDLIRLSRRLRAFAMRLADRRRTQFVAVVRPAALPRLETARLLDRLRMLHLASPVLIVNAETAGGCAGCVRRAGAERKELALLRRMCRGAAGPCDIIHAPLWLPPPRGVGELREWSAAWRRDGDG